MIAELYCFVRVDVWEEREQGSFGGCVEETGGKCLRLLTDQRYSV